jgi:hypothetical protein
MIDPWTTTTNKTRAKRGERHRPRRCCPTSDLSLRRADYRPLRPRGVGLRAARGRAVPTYESPVCRCSCFWRARGGAAERVVSITRAFLCFDFYVTVKKNGGLLDRFALGLVVKGRLQ